MHYKVLVWLSFVGLVLAEAQFSTPAPNYGQLQYTTGPLEFPGFGNTGFGNQASFIDVGISSFGDYQSTPSSSAGFPVPVYFDQGTYQRGSIYGSIPVPVSYDANSPLLPNSFQNGNHLFVNGFAKKSGPSTVTPVFKSRYRYPLQSTPTPFKVAHTPEPYANIQRITTVSPVTPSASSVPQASPVSQAPQIPQAPSFLQDPSRPQTPPTLQTPSAPQASPFLQDPTRPLGPPTLQTPSASQGPPFLQDPQGSQAPPALQDPSENPAASSPVIFSHGFKKHPKSSVKLFRPDVTTYSTYSSPQLQELPENKPKLLPYSKYQKIPVPVEFTSTNPLTKTQSILRTFSLVPEIDPYTLKKKYQGFSKKDQGYQSADKNNVLVSSAVFPQTRINTESESESYAKAIAYITNLLKANSVKEPLLYVGTTPASETARNEFTASTIAPDTSYKGGTNLLRSRLVGEVYGSTTPFPETGSSPIYSSTIPPSINFKDSDSNLIRSNLQQQSQLGNFFRGSTPAPEISTTPGNFLSSSIVPEPAFDNSNTDVLRSNLAQQSQINRGSTTLPEVSTPNSLLPSGGSEVDFRGINTNLARNPLFYNVNTTPSPEISNAASGFFSTPLPESSFRSGNTNLLRANLAKQPLVFIGPSPKFSKYPSGFVSTTTAPGDNVNYGGTNLLKSNLANERVVNIGVPQTKNLNGFSSSTSVSHVSFQGRDANYSY